MGTPSPPHFRDPRLARVRTATPTLPPLSEMVCDASVFPRLRGSVRRPGPSGSHPSGRPRGHSLGELNNLFYRFVFGCKDAATAAVNDKKLVFVQGPGLVSILPLRAKSRGARQGANLDTKDIVIDLQGAPRVRCKVLNTCT